MTRFRLISWFGLVLIVFQVAAAALMPTVTVASVQDRAMAEGPICGTQRQAPTEAPILPAGQADCVHCLFCLPLLQGHLALTEEVAVPVPGPRWDMAVARPPAMVPVQPEPVRPWAPPRAPPGV
ncbi:DUF2946 family protein [Magnetospirillum fulvum]|uniref:DUF2946 domain-containing protein n=1 Tax=Magnetospirillum fulvum TaxID=1082 RepID=A0A1H6GUC9_MAGFU|nr:DUF2946 family protein [Magnetospirillum fulvum]SEH25444.1 hypothetical protein SAMN04244559_00200 [Magnetospirillum fulvum]